MRKDEDQIDAMVRAGEIADRAYLAVTSQAVIGLSEIELAGRLEAEMLAAGAEGVAFQTLVASGPNGALPHHRAGPRRIEAGDVVILDFGCRVAGYCSDVSRTVVCGEADPELLKVHDAVRRAHAAARDAARIGASRARRLGRGRIRRSVRAQDRPRHRSRRARAAIHRGGKRAAIGAGDDVLDRTRGVLSGTVRRPNRGRRRDH
jgi:Xaa-Pro aminopeptidase